MSLKVLPVKGKNADHWPKLDKRLPQPPFLGIVQGGVRSGKSVLMTNLVLNPSFYRDDIFDHVVVVSPTCHNDDSLKPLAECCTVFAEYDDEIVESLVKIANKQREKGEKIDHVLLILDDCVGMIQRGSAIANLCTRYRHYKISIIITSQLFRAVPNVCRTNMSFYIIFKTENAKELAKMEEELGTTIPNFMKLYSAATKEKYHFMYINFRHMSVYENFEKLLWQKNE